MVGPFLQGVMLISVIFVYSKSILSMINEYYREGFKSELEKDYDKLEKIKGLSKSSESLNIEKSKDGIIVNRDVIPSPTIEGIPDIFHTPTEKTSIIMNYEETGIKDKVINNDVCPVDFSDYASDENRNKYESLVYPPDLLNLNEFSRNSKSSINNFDTNNKRKLLNSIKSSTDSDDNIITSDINLNLKDTDKTYNKLNYISNLNKPIHDNFKNIPKIELHPVQEHIRITEKYRNNYCNGNDKDFNNVNGNCNHIITKKNEVNLNEEQKSFSTTNVNHENSISQTTTNLHVNLKKKVCNIRRKSVNEMVQYWDQQINLFEDNQQVPDIKRRKSIGNLKSNVPNC